MRRGCRASGGQGLRCHHSAAQGVSQAQIQGERGQVGGLPHCPVRVLQGRKSGVLCIREHRLPMSTVQAQVHTM